VGQVVGDWLSTPEYSHFCLPSSKGGTAGGNASRPVGASISLGGPKNLGEAIVIKWREESATRPNHLQKPIGLRRNR
jgi:hypothetical protein